MEVKGQGATSQQPMKLDRPWGCKHCGVLMQVGTEVNLWKDETGNWARSHLGECPAPKKPARGMNLKVDGEDLYVVRKCSRPAGSMWDSEAKRLVLTANRVCGQVTAFRRGSLVPPRCPYCNADWVRGNVSGTNLKEAWAV